LSTILAARDDDGTGFTDRHVRDEIMTLMLAGHETTANLLAWVWYALATEPAAQARLDAELAVVLGGRPPTYDDLPRLPVTLAILEEALRLYLPAHTIAPGRSRRRTAAPIAKGAIVTVSVVAMQRRAYWDDRSRSARAVPGRRSQGAAGRLPAVRRRAAGVHRQPLRAGRGPADPGRVGPALPLPPGPAGAGRARAADDAAPQGRRLGRADRPIV
jgi:hypothetical protein